MKKYFSILFAVIVSMAFLLLFVNSFFNVEPVTSVTASLIVVCAGLLVSSKNTANAVFIGLPCFTLNKDLGYQCGKPLTAGTDERLLLINPSDIASIIRDPLNSQVITSITLKSGKTGFLWTGLKNSNDPVVTGVEGEYYNTIQQQINGIIFDTSFEAEEVLNNLFLNNTPIIAIVRRRDKNDEGKREFRIYGIDEPLYLRALSQTTNDTANGGAWVITLQNDDANSSNLPQALYDTDRATTIQAYESLLPAQAPVISSISSVSGETGDSITLTGSGFTGALQVIFGASVAGTSLLVVSDTSIVVDVPVIAPGVTTIKVLSPSGFSNTMPFTVTV